MISLGSRLIELNRVGKTLSRHLKRLGVVSARDLLFYFPFRYEDYRAVVPIKDLRDGLMATVRAKVELIANKRGWKSRKLITEALVADKSGSLRVVWFNQPYIVKILKPGDTVNLSGKVKFDMLGAQLISPMYERVQATATPSNSPLVRGRGRMSPSFQEGAGGVAEVQPTTHTGRLVPIYPLTEGITQKQMRFLVSQVMGLTEKIREWIPEEILEKNDLVSLPAALRGIHFPADEQDLARSTARLKFGELFLLQLKAELAKVEKNRETAPVLKFFEEPIRDFVGGLPFELTRAQKVAAWEILRDLAKTTPMNRLLSGDVGSGKTVVAAMAMYGAALNGHQAALMAPTEILARQHYNSITGLLGKYGVGVGLFTRSQRMISNGRIKDKRIDDKNIIISKKKIMDLIKSGELSIVIGTHALLSEKVEFKNLGLTIVDEQHRFGVEQRKEIKRKTNHPSPLLRKEGTRQVVPHFLSMTATPIPRSLALLLYGDLDLSVLNEMPPGRKKIITRLVEPVKRDKAYEFIRQQVKQGRQAFVVCPLIEGQRDGGQSDSEKNGTVFNVPLSHVPRPLADRKSVMSEYEKLSQEIFPDLRINFIHGKLPAQGRSASGGKEKNKGQVMEDFKNGKFDILISTSVVEVGVDVPNASVMMIEGAERFGLAQLHQFRGRVGRAQHQSYCLLFTSSDAPKALERLKYFEQNSDGFKLAEKDLELRGPGEVYGPPAPLRGSGEAGVAQSGLMNLRLAKLTDRDLIKKARDSAREIVGRIDDFTLLKKRMEKFEKEVHLE